MNIEGGGGIVNAQLGNKLGSEEFFAEREKIENEIEQLLVSKEVMSELIKKFGITSKVDPFIVFKSHDGTSPFLCRIYFEDTKEILDTNCEYTRNPERLKGIVSGKDISMELDTQSLNHSEN